LTTLKAINFKISFVNILVAIRFVRHSVINFPSRLTCSGSTVSHLLATKPAGFDDAEAGGGEFAGADVLGALPSGSPSRLSSLPLSAAAAAAGLYHWQRDETNTQVENARLNLPACLISWEIIVI
jgi:hypothetical protein